MIQASHENRARSLWLSNFRSPARAAARFAAGISLLLLIIFAAAAGVARADEPFAPTREYDLQNARIELRFAIDQRKVIGKVTNTVAALHDGLQTFDFDCVALDIQQVSVNGKDATFKVDGAGLHVNLERPSKTGEKYDIAIRYQGTPQKGLYFVLPDASYPDQPKEIWTQGEAEDTRYYLPIYDYPNNRESTQMIVTVPGNWITVSNGKLESVTDAGDGQKTWTWRQSQPISSYLISLVAGEFDSSQQTWRKLPMDFHVPHGEADRIQPTFAHTSDMLTFFSDRLGVPYPWVKYDQTVVDQFVEGGMENVSATTLTTRGLLDPVLAKESLERSDNLISHELSHQWFGDLVTCKDWTNLWLNEGFATFMAQIWEEHEFGADNAEYARWRSQNAWMRQTRLFGVPIVTRDFKDAMQNAGNTYGKSGLVLEMLREKLGDRAFFAALTHYLDANRLGNVVTADLVRALEESTHVNLDRFFYQWITGAGAPRFMVSSSYDADAKQVRLNVKQTQEIRGSVGLFDVPVEIGVTTATGSHSFQINVTKAEETFSFAAESAPVMVLFDKGDKILKSVEFHKPAADWIYQLQKAENVADRASAAQALGGVKDDNTVVAALGEAAVTDPYWGVREEAVTALGRIGGPAAQTRVLAALKNSQPWVRESVASQLSHFHDNDVVVPALEDLIRNDAAYRVRSAALTSLGQLHAPNTLATLQAAVNTDSPDDIIRRAGLRALGSLGDDKAVSTLLSYAVQGKPLRLRETAIGSLAQLDKKNPAIESQLIGYLHDPNYDIRVATLFALGDRGDPAAIGPLEELLHTGVPTLGDPAHVEMLIEQLRNPHAKKTADESQGAGGQQQTTTATGAAASAPATVSAGGVQQLEERLERVERVLAEMNDRLKTIEQQLPAKTGP